MILATARAPNRWERLHGTLCLDMHREPIVIGVPAYASESDVSSSESELSLPAIITL
ncbi:MAG: hypothetical protein ABIP94_06310 [Planctomycetota bacterium]